jgi:hypothetical protein
MKKPLLLSFMLLLIPTLHAAELANAETMGELLDNYGPRLRLVDARDNALRSKEPLAGAIVYSATTRVSAGIALVVGNDDAGALAAAAALEKRDTGVRAYAAQGGTNAYKAAHATYLGAPVEDLSAHGFVIPRDTCQTGEPAHVFEAK